MNIVFMGTPEFSVPSLEALAERHRITAVVTQPDRPKGRGKKLFAPPVKKKAESLGIPVLQPERVKEKDFIEELKKMPMDMIVVVAFGQILPEEILTLPKYGAINVHGSLLPKYRGAAPIQWAVIHGEEKTGVTTMMMAKGLDSGDILLTEEIPLQPDETYGSLRDRMAQIGAVLLKKTVEGLEKQEIMPIPQNHEEATYAPMITKETERIDWNRKTEEILCLIRGLSPEPVAYTMLLEEPIKLWRAEAAEIQKQEAKNGEIIAMDKKGFVVKTADSSIRILELQARGGKKMAADAYMRGHDIRTSLVLS